MRYKGIVASLEANVSNVFHNEGVCFFCFFFPLMDEDGKYSPDFKAEWGEFVANPSGDPTQCLVFLQLEGSPELCSTKQLSGASSASHGSNAWTAANPEDNSALLSASLHCRRPAGTALAVGTLRAMGFLVGRFSSEG